MFQGCAVVNVKTGGIFFRIAQIGESVQSLSSAIARVVLFTCVHALSDSHRTHPTTAWLK